MQTNFIKLGQKSKLSLSAMVAMALSFLLYATMIDDTGERIIDLKLKDDDFILYSNPEKISKRFNYTKFDNIQMKLFFDHYYDVLVDVKVLQQGKDDLNANDVKGYFQQNDGTDCAFNASKLQYNNSDGGTVKVAELPKGFKVECVNQDYLFSSKASLEFSNDSYHLQAVKMKWRESEIFAQKLLLRNKAYTADLGAGFELKLRDSKKYKADCVTITGDSMFVDGNTGRALINKDPKVNFKQGDLYAEKLLIKFKNPAANKKSLKDTWLSLKQELSLEELEFSGMVLFSCKSYVVRTQHAVYDHAKQIMQVDNPLELEYRDKVKLTAPYFVYDMRLGKGMIFSDKELRQLVDMYGAAPFPAHAIHMLLADKNYPALKGDNFPVVRNGGRKKSTLPNEIKPSERVTMVIKIS